MPQYEVMLTLEFEAEDEHEASYKLEEEVITPVEEEGFSLISYGIEPLFDEEYISDE